VKHPAASALVSRETTDRLSLFADLLATWSTRINLVSRRDLTVLWPRHIEDCLQLVPLIAAAQPPWIDLGSGAGFPGLVLAIATGCPVHLIEADQRKASFLREAARLTAAPATVHATRVESVTLPPAAAVTARALAPLPDLLALAAPFVRPDGFCLFLKGRHVDAELTAASARWQMRVERTASVTDPDASILKLSELRFVGPDRRDSRPRA